MRNITVQCQAFEALMEATNKTTRAPISGCVDLPNHPFPQLPPPPTSDITYLGYGMMDVEVEGFKRIIGWEMVNGCIGGTRSVAFLREIVSTPDPEDPKQTFYFFEIGIGRGSDDFCELYMIGENMYAHAPQQRYRRELEVIWQFLSEIYGVKNQKAGISHEDGRKALAFIEKERERQQPEREGYEKKQRAIEKARYHFHKSQKVAWSTQAFHAHLPHNPKKNDVFEVLGVEIIPDYCSCGLKEKADIRFHPEGRCNLRRRFEARHHQILTLKVRNHKERFSGIYFIPIDAL